MLDYSQQHEMLLDKTYPTGAEEWYCPTCGRRFVMQWPPKYKRIMLNAGDIHVSHAGGKGGLMMSHVEVTGVEEQPEDLSLPQWENWLNDLNFEERPTDTSPDLE